MRRFPGIAFRGPEHDRRAWLLGTALDIWKVIEAHQSLGSLETSDLSTPHINVPLAYYTAYPGEIDRAIAAHQGSQETWHHRYPTLVLND